MVKSSASCLVASVLALVVTASSKAAAADPPLSTNQMTALSPAAADHRVRRDLLSVLRPLGERLRTGMRIQLRDATLGTRPYGTAYDGLCRRDELWLKYVSADPTPPARDQPMQPYGFESRALFHAVRPPKAIEATRQALSNVWNRDCDGLADKDQLTWFAAPNEDDAAQAVALLQSAIALVRSGALKPQPCVLPRSEQRTCERMIAEDASMAAIDDVRPCGEPSMVTACYDIAFGSGLVLTIVGDVGDDTLTPAKIDSIAVRYEIVVT